jgi:hypothetical protein
MRRQDRRPDDPVGPSFGADKNLYLLNLRRAYQIRRDRRVRERRIGVLILIALALLLAFAAISESVWSSTDNADVAAVDRALVNWSRLAPRHPLRVESYRLDVARALAGGAARYGLPVELITAMTLRESSGRQDARGRAGELGLMQVSPDTAARFHCALATVNEQADCGCRILAKHLARCAREFGAGTSEERSLRGALAVYGSRTGSCTPPSGGGVERMVSDRLRLASKLREVMNAGSQSAPSPQSAPRNPTASQGGTK